MKFTREDLTDLAYQENDDRYEVVLKEFVEMTRWSVLYRQVFKFDGKFYETSFREPATECQEEEPYEWVGSDGTECGEVVPVAAVKIEYQAAEQ